MIFRDQLLIVFEKLDKGFVSDSNEPGHRVVTEWHPQTKMDDLAKGMRIPRSEFPR